jgi:hypothetical protein
VERTKFEHLTTAHSEAVDIFPDFRISTSEIFYFKDNRSPLRLGGYLWYFVDILNIICTWNVPTLNISLPRIAEREIKIFLAGK